MDKLAYKQGVFEALRDFCRESGEKTAVLWGTPNSLMSQIPPLPPALVRSLLGAGVGGAAGSLLADDPVRGALGGALVGGFAGQVPSQMKNILENQRAIARKLVGYRSNIDALAGPM